VQPETNTRLSRRVALVVAALGVVTLAVLALALHVGRGGSSCDRGFAKETLRAQPVSTGHKIARCGWFNGWSARRVYVTMGGHNGQYGHIETYLLDEAHSIGPAEVVLIVAYDRPRGHVKHATVEIQPY
jgi:hypothetical protein